MLVAGRSPATPWSVPCARGRLPGAGPLAPGSPPGCPAPRPPDTGPGKGIRTTCHFRMNVADRPPTGTGGPVSRKGELHGLQEGHEGSEARPPGGPGRPPHQGTPRPSGGYSPSPPASCRHTSPSASCRFKQPSENRLLVSSHGESIVVRHSPLVRGRKRVGVGVEHAGGAVRKERWRRERWRKKALKEMRIEFARASSSGVVLYVESTS